MLSEPRRVLLQTAAGWVPGTLERCGANLIVVRAPVSLAVGDALRVRISGTVMGELTLEAVLRWIDDDGNLALQLGALRVRELVALRRLVPDELPDARLSLRRQGYRVDGRMDPFGSSNERTYPADGIPIALILVNAEIEGVAIEIEPEQITVIAWVVLDPGVHVALRVYEDPTGTSWSDRAMTVRACENGLITLVPQQSRW